MGKAASYATESKDRSNAIKDLATTTKHLTTVASSAAMNLTTVASSATLFGSDNHEDNGEGVGCDSRATVHSSPLSTSLSFAYAESPEPANDAAAPSVDAATSSHIPGGREPTARPPRLTAYPSHGLSGVSLRWVPARLPQQT